MSEPTELKERYGPIANQVSFGSCLAVRAAFLPARWWPVRPRFTAAPCDAGCVTQGGCEELEPACSRTPPRSASRSPSRPRESSRTPSRARRRRTTQTPPRGATSPAARTHSVVPASPGVTHTPVGGQSVMEERGTTHRFVLSSVWRCSVGCRGPLLETLLGGCSEYMRCGWCWRVDEASEAYRGCVVSTR